MKLASALRFLLALAIPSLTLLSVRPPSHARPCSYSTPWHKTAHLTEKPGSSTTQLHLHFCFADRHCAPHGIKVAFARPGSYLSSPILLSSTILLWLHDCQFAAGPPCQSRSGDLVRIEFEGHSPRMIHCASRVRHFGQSRWLAPLPTWPVCLTWSLRFLHMLPLVHRCACPLPDGAAVSVLVTVRITPLQPVVNR